MSVVAPSVRGVATTALTPENRLQDLLRTAARELSHRREDVLSSRLLWPTRDLDRDECAAFLRALDTGLAVLDAAGSVSTAGQGRLPLLFKSGIGVEVDVDHVRRVGALAPDRATPSRGSQ